MALCRENHGNKLQTSHQIYQKAVQGLPSHLRSVLSISILEALGRLIPPVYGGWVCWIDFMHHIVETPSKRPYPDRLGSILVELSNRLYDSGPKSKSKIRIGYLGSKFGSKSGSWIQVEAHLRQKGTGVRECNESVFGASKNRKFKNAQNEILDVRC